MIAGFIFWTVLALGLMGIGIYAWKADKPVGFFAGVEAPKVKDTKRYNHEVAVLWFVYAAVIELCGVPLLFLEQNSPIFVVTILGTVFASIAMAVVYTVVISRHQE